MKIQNTSFGGHVGYYTLIRDAAGHVFRMKHADTPPDGFTEIPDVCDKNGILKNSAAFGFERIQFVFPKGKPNRVARYSPLTEAEIKSLSVKACPNDTDGDGHCANRYCPICRPQ